MKKGSKGVCLHQRRTLGAVRADALIYQQHSAPRFKFQCGEILPDIAIAGFHLRDARAPG